MSGLTARPIRVRPNAARDVLLQTYVPSKQDCATRPLMRDGAVNYMFHEGRVLTFEINHRYDASLRSRVNE